MKELHQHFCDGVLQSERVLDITEADGLTTITEYLKGEAPGEWRPSMMFVHRYAGKQLLFHQRFHAENGQWVLDCEIHNTLDGHQRIIRSESFERSCSQPYSVALTSHRGNRSLTRTFRNTEPSGTFTEEDYRTETRITCEGNVRDIRKTSRSKKVGVFMDSHEREEIDPQTGERLSVTIIHPDGTEGHSCRYTYRDGKMVHISTFEGGVPESEIDFEYVGPRERTRTERRLRDGRIELDVTTPLDD